MALINVIETLGIYDVLVVPTLVELKALTDTGTGANKRTDGGFRIVKSPGTNLPPMMYVYRAELTAEDALPGIVQPTDETGAWIAQDPFTIATTKPINPPTIVNQEWRATLSTPDRLVRWKAYALSSIPLAADWSPVRGDIPILGAPTFEPDYLGQVVINTANQNRYKAIALVADASSWSQIN